MPMYRVTFNYIDSGEVQRELDLPTPSLLDAAQCADAYLRGWMGAIDKADVRAEKRRALGIALTRIVEIETERIEA